MDLWAKYPHSPSVVIERLRQQTGKTVSKHAVMSLRKHHGADIEEARRAYVARLREEVPLATPRDRATELYHQYALTVRQLFRELCPTCLGAGVEAKAKRGQAVRCGGCKGRRWILPDHVREALRLLEGDVRLETVTALLWEDLPVDGDKVLMDRLVELTQAIREEVGDAWSPREKGEVGAGSEAGSPGSGAGMKPIVVVTGNSNVYIEQLRALRGAPKPLQSPVTIEVPAEPPHDDPRD